MSGSIQVNHSFVSSNSANNHQPVKPLVDKTRFKEIEHKATNGKHDKVNLSAKSLFLFKLNVHAANIEDDAKRNQFVDALKSSGDKIFTKAYLERLRNPFFSGENISASDKPFPKLNIGGVADPNQSGVIVHSISFGVIDEGIVSKRRQVNSLGERDNRLEPKIKELVHKASKSLSAQDLVTVKGVMERAFIESNKTPANAFSILDTNNDFDTAQYAINNLPLNKELKQSVNNLLTEIRSSYTQSIHNYMQVQNQKIEDYPQHAAGIRENQLAIKEGLSIHNKLQDYLKNSNSGFLESESYFQSLIGDARYIKLMDADETSKLYDYFKADRAEFKRVFIDKKWVIEQPKPEKSAHDLAFEIVDKETQVLSKQYIDAISAYIKTAKSS